MARIGLEKNTALEYVSASRLKLWLRCPAAYKRRYVDGIITPSNPKLFLGKEVHRALEFYYRHHRRGVKVYPDYVAEHIRQTWSHEVDEECVTFETAEQDQELQDQAIGLVQAYLGQVREHESMTLLVEERFEAPLIDPRTGEDLGISLVGIVDLVSDEGEGPCIVDFKTAARSSSQVNVIHELQMSCYSYLFREACGLKEAGLQIRSLIKTKTPKIERQHFAPRQERDFGRMFDVIRAYLSSVRSEQFYIRPSMECSFCDFREACAGNESSNANGSIQLTSSRHRDFQSGVAGSVA